MKIKTLIAAAAFATASTVAVADVTTADGEVVMIEKNQSALLLTQFGPIIFSSLIVAVAAAGGS